jgi:hypothetical protein
MVNIKDKRQVNQHQKAFQLNYLQIVMTFLEKKGDNDIFSNIRKMISIQFLKKTLPCLSLQSLFLTLAL